MDWLAFDRCLIIGHRGASADAPENTLAAFRRAAENGADGIELDVRLSGDGDVVVIHDATVDRTTNGQGSVASMTVAELQALDAGSGEYIPTLDEVFALFGDSFLYNVELKGSGARDRGLEAAVAELITTHNLERQVVVSSFNQFSLRRARRLLPSNTMTAVLWYYPPYWRHHFFTDADADHPH